MKYSIIEIQQAVTDVDEALIFLKDAHKDLYTESMKVMFSLLLVRNYTIFDTIHEW